jgi:hypothetical protein
MTPEERLAALEAQMANVGPAMRSIAGILEDLVMWQFPGNPDDLVDVPIPPDSLEAQVRGVQSIAREANRRKAWARTRLARLDKIRDALPPA